MAVYLGSTALTGIKLGSAGVLGVYLGTSQVWSASSPVQFIGANASTSGSVTIPTHQVGDLIVLAAFDAQNTAPTKPAAGGTVPDWVYIDSANTASGQSCITTAQFKATATNTTSGSWTWGEQMIAVVLRGQNASTPVGGHSSVGGQGVNITAPSVTLDRADGTSVLLHFHSSAFLNGSGWSTAPAGYTRRAVAGPSSSRSLLLNTKDSTTTDGAVTQPDGSSGWAYAAATVEIKN